MNERPVCEGSGAAVEPTIRRACCPVCYAVWGPLPVELALADEILIPPHRAPFSGYRADSFWIDLRRPEDE